VATKKAAIAAKTIKITMIKSVIGASPTQRKTVEALGLRKLNHTVEHPDSPQTRGAIFKIRHLVQVQEL
jgi:large subunit ribosomal protein L30